MKRLSIFLLLSIAPFLASIEGCSSSTSTTTQNYVIVQGNVYNYSSRDSSTSGTITQSSTKDSVISADTTYQGKQHCFAVRSDTSTFFYHLESNGDLSYYYPSNPVINNLGATWLVLPYGSKAGNTIVYTTSGNISASGFSFLTYDTTSLAYIGTDTLTVNGKLLQLGKVTVNVVYTVTGLLSGTATFQQTLEYSPDIAYIAKKNYQLIPSASLASYLTGTAGSTSVLTSYTIH